MTILSPLTRAFSTQSLRKSLFFVFVFLSIIAFPIAAGFEIYYNYRSEQDVIMSRQQLIAGNTAHILEDYISQHLKTMQTVAEAHLLASKDEEASRQLVLDTLLGTVSDFRQVLFFTPGRTELESGSRMPGVHGDQLTVETEHALFSQVLRGEVYVSDVMIDPSAYEPIVILAVPVYDKFKTLRYVMVAETNVKYLWEYIGNQETVPSGDMYVVDQHGTLIVSHDVSRVLRQENLSALPAVKRFVEGMRDIPGHEMSTGEGLMGRKVLAHSAQLSYPYWAVVVETDAALVYREVLPVALLSFALVVFCALAAALAGVYIQRVITSPIIKLRDVAASFDEGKLDEPIVAEVENEVGELAGAFDLMRKKIRSYVRVLEAGKSQLFASLSSLPVGVLLLDTDLQALFINPKLIEVLGLSTADITLSGVKEKLTGYDLDGQILRSQKQKEVIVQREVEVGKCVFRIVTAPIFSVEHRENIGVVVVIWDITEEKVIERSRDEFFSIASHELRTPLTAIRGNTSILMDTLKEPPVDTDALGMVSDINEASEQLIHIVNDLLFLSRLEQGKMAFKNEPIDLVPLVAFVVERMVPSALQKSLTLSFCEPDRPLPLVSADSDRVIQVVENLLGNALNHTSSGGIEVRVVELDGSLKVSVRDTGSGIALKNQPLLFHKLQQAGDTIYVRDVIHGSGLGLYTSKLMVEHMGGKIVLEWSEEGKGSEFSFTVPLAMSEV